MTLPDPLVPADVDLRGLEYMPLLGNHLFGSAFEGEATDREFRVGLRLWWAAWNQQPAASLPTSDKALCKLAGLGDALPTWRKLKARALHNFVLCSDGRLYHEFLSKQAIVAWEKRVEVHKKNSAEADRKARERAYRSRIFEALRAIGITPEWNIKTADLRDLEARHLPDLSRGQRPPVTVPVTPDVTPPVTAKTRRDVTRRDVKEKKEARATSSRAPQDGFQPTRAGAICRAMKDAGIGDSNPGHADLKALLDAGATEAEFAGAAATAAKKGKGFGYALGIVTSQRREAADKAKGLHRGEMNGHAWDATQTSIRQKGVELGEGDWDRYAFEHGVRGAETFQAYTKRVRKALTAAKATTKREEHHA